MLTKHSQHHLSHAHGVTRGSNHRTSPKLNDPIKHGRCTRAATSARLANWLVSLWTSPHDSVLVPTGTNKGRLALSTCLKCMRCCTGAPPCSPTCKCSTSNTTSCVFFDTTRGCGGMQTAATCESGIWSSSFIILSTWVRTSCP